VHKTKISNITAQIYHNSTKCKGTCISPVGWGTALHARSSIPDGVIRIFHCCNPSFRTRALKSTQPLRGMSNMNISWRVKPAGALGWQPYHIHMPIVLKSGSLNLLEPSGPVRACNGTILPSVNGNSPLCNKRYLKYTDKNLNKWKEQMYTGKMTLLCIIWTSRHNIY